MARHAWVIVVADVPARHERPLIHGTFGKFAEGR
jgi:hypothetical protein